MELSKTGESRILGYLYTLERSMRAAVSPQLTADAVREVESHIRDRIAESNGVPNERDALETILARLGKPADVARAYSLEMIMEEAAIGGRIVPVMLSVFRAAATGVIGFFIAVGLFSGYGVGVAFIIVAVLKPIFPHNVGFWMDRDLPTLGAQFPTPGGIEPAGGYWIVPIALIAGLAILLLVHRAARHWISSVRERLVSRRTIRSGWSAGAAPRHEVRRRGA